MHNETRRKSLEQNINLPDRLFSGFVQEEYGINKGIYNTIDLWFYKNGLHNLLIRRKTIINFLRNVHESMYLEGKQLKFGNGGLSVKLNDYWENNHLIKAKGIV
jgi:riboflavin kinase